MAWTFKDRYKPTRTVTVDSDVPAKLRRLGETFEAFRQFNGFTPAEQRQALESIGGDYSTLIKMHTTISFCIGTYDVEDDFYYSYYCKAVRTQLIDVHPAFAAKKFSEYICFMRHQNELLEECQFLKDNVEMPSIDLIIEGCTESFDKQ